MEEMHASATSTRLALWVLAATIAFLVGTFQPLVNALALWTWTGLFAALLGGLVWVAGRLPMREIDPEEAMHFWLPLGKALMLAINALVAASVWIFLPAAGPELRALMFLLYAWFPVIQIMATSRSGDVTPAAIVLLLGSLIAFELSRGTPFGLPICAFLLLFGATLMRFRQTIRSALIEALGAHARAERACAALDEALAEVAAQRDAMTEFVASASHDLQQPIQAASLYFDHAVGAASPTARARAIAGARRAFATTEELLQAMLEHLRVRSGALAVRREALILADTVRAVVEEQRAMAEHAGLALRLAGLDRAVVADPLALRRILGNLIVNAVRHSRGTRLLIGARPMGSKVAVHVIDDGAGIDARARARLFEAFARGGSADSNGNFGLGLSTARRLAGALGGELELAKGGSQGAHFILTLPAAPAAPRAPLPAPSPPTCEAV